MTDEAIGNVSDVVRHRQIERRLVALQAQALGEPAGVLAQHRQTDEEGVLERGGQIDGACATSRGEGKAVADGETISGWREDRQAEGLGFADHALVVGDQCAKLTRDA